MDLRYDIEFRLNIATKGFVFIVEEVRVCHQVIELERRAMLASEFST